MDKAVQSHRDLEVWQKAMDLAVEAPCYLSPVICSLPL
jgi:hypothetical protein